MPTPIPPMPADLRARIAAIEARFATSTPDVTAAGPSVGTSASATSSGVFDALLSQALGTAGTLSAGAAPPTSAAGSLTAGVGLVGSSAGTRAPGVGSGGSADAAKVARLAGDERFGRFAVDLLDRLGMPQTEQNRAAVVAWARAEGTRATHNPLATTQRMGAGETSFNSVGVKDYPSYEIGLDATVRTMRNGRYDQVLAALARGDDAAAVGRAVEASPWGTGGGLLRVLGTA